MDYMSTDFGADSSSCFPFRVQTDRQAGVTNALPRPGGYIAGVGNKSTLYKKHTVYQSTKKQKKTFK